MGHSALAPAQASLNRSEALAGAVVGRRVHKEFDDLVSRSGDPELFGETGYLHGRVVQKIGNAWPAGTSAPDGVFGVSRAQPEALFDLKTGEKGILAGWIDTITHNLGQLVGSSTVPVFTLHC